MSKTILEVENLSFRYDIRREAEILKDVNFSVKRGEWVAIIGHNGSGKSTLAKLLVGLYTAEKGRICISNIEMNELTKWQIRRQIGIVFQNPDNQFIGTTVQDDVAFALENMNLSYDEMKLRINDALKTVGISELRSVDPSRLSGGQKQRVAIAGILALMPDILLLDEALVMLDPRSRRETISTLQQIKTNKNISVISITHDMNEAAEADRILVMEEGRIVNSGSPKQVFTKQRIKLELPIAEQLRRELKKRGRKLADEYMSEIELVESICK